ncbi:hypothetical protein AOLI_G00202080 [Acnodon oligacanthus]
MVLSQLAAFFTRYPYSSSVLFSLVLVVLEKFFENDFVCPCESGYTEAFFCFYLLAPMFIAFVFGLYLLSFRCVCCSGRKKCCSAFCKFLACSIPSAVWLAVFFCDGRYIACLNTELKGEYADSADPSPWKWCERNQTRTDDQLRALTSFYKSKLGGFGVLVFITVIALLYKCCKKYCECLNFSEH